MTKSKCENRFKALIFRCFQTLNVRYSDPHHMLNDVNVFISLILTGLGPSAEMREKEEE